MLRLLVRALVVFWPFFKSVIFKDRPVKEVLRVNRQFTLLFVVLIVTLFLLFITAGALRDTKGELIRARNDAVTLTKENRELKSRAAAAKDVVTDSSRLSCNLTPYDKQRVINLLGE